MGLGKMIKVGVIVISVACICFASIFYSMEQHQRELASDLPVESAAHVTSTDADLARRTTLESSALDDDTTTRSIRGLFKLHVGQASGSSLAFPHERVVAEPAKTFRTVLRMPPNARSTNDATPTQANSAKVNYNGVSVSAMYAAPTETSEISRKDGGVEEQAVHRGRNLELVLELASDVETDATTGEPPETSESAGEDVAPVAVPAAEEESPLDNVQASEEQPSSVKLELASDIEPIVTPTIRLPEQEPLAEGIASSGRSTLQSNESQQSNATTSSDKVEASVVEGSSKASRKAMAKARAAEAAEAKRQQKEARAAALATERAATVAVALEDRVQRRARSAISSCFEPTCPRPWRDASGERRGEHFKVIRTSHKNPFPCNHDRLIQVCLLY